MSGAERLTREEIYSGRIVTLVRDTVRLPDGGAATLEHVSHPGAAAVLPLLDPPTAPDPRIVLIEQYRYSAGRCLCEIPAGIPDSPTEGWEACARRELTEETGYEAGEMRYLTGIFTTPGFTNERLHLFAGAGLVERGAHRDRDEFIEVVVLPLSRALEWIRLGRLEDAKSVAALLFAHAFLAAVWAEARSAPPR